MDQVVKFLQPYQRIQSSITSRSRLLFVAVLIDLVASMSPTRIWLRYTALLLMILGAIRRRRFVFHPVAWRATASGTRWAHPPRKS